MKRTYLALLVASAMVVLSLAITLPGQTRVLVPDKDNPHELVEVDAHEKVVPPQTRVYNVRDLIAGIPDYAPPTFVTNGVSREWEEGPAAGGGIFDNDEDEPDMLESEERLMVLIDILMTAVEPGTWDEDTGYAIRGRGGLIVVTHQPVVLQKIEKLLANLRKQGREKMLSVRMTLFNPEPRALDEVMKSGKLLAVSDKEKAELKKVIAEVVSESHLLAMDGQKIYNARTKGRNFTVGEKDKEDVVTISEGLISWSRPTVAPDGTVLLNFGASLASVGARHPNAKTVPSVSVSNFLGTHRIPDGGML